MYYLSKLNKETLMKSDGGTGPMKSRQPSIFSRGIEVVLNPAKWLTLWKMREREDKC